jgi:hypothetical protein
MPEPQLHGMRGRGFRSGATGDMRKLTCINHEAWQNPRQPHVSASRRLKNAINAKVHRATTCLLSIRRRSDVTFLAFQAMSQHGSAAFKGQDPWP